MMRPIPPKPTDAKWTDDQWKAIYAKGKDTLVAAAAGSGKTAVLIERIIQKILDPEDGTDVDRLLVVTFTQAAAQEMRNRMGEAIEGELKKNPTSTHLRKQLSLLGSASISTIHSFCLEVIRSYYYEIELDPGFRIGDETELQLIKDEVLEGLLEEEYGKEVNPEFFKFVDAYTSDRDDDSLKEMIEKLFVFAVTNPDPDQFLDALVEGYTLPANATMNDILAIDYVYLVMLHEAEKAKYMQMRAIMASDTTLVREKYMEVLKEEMSLYEHFLQASRERDWGKMKQRYVELEFGRIPPKTKADDPEVVESIKGFRDEAKKLKKNLSSYFQRSEEQYLQDIRLLKPYVEELVRLVKRFMHAFIEAKRQEAIVDFHDVEHYCLKILRKWDESLGMHVPSQVAKQYKLKFSEVLVDEYQDTNRVQEEIVRAVTTSEPDYGNMFMVGDVKQSIYRFRQAEPKLFLEKYAAFDSFGEGEGCRIDLSKNFRSRDEVLQATNFIFERIMDSVVGEVNYDDAAALYLGASYPKSDQMDTELWIVDRSEDEEGAGEFASDSDSDEAVSDVAPGSDEFSFEELERQQIEARMMIERIRKLRSDGFTVYDGKRGEERSLQYKDIVILVRSMTWAPDMMDEFRKAGIPIYAELSTGYFDAIEVGVFLSLLQVIDNPQQDIPLASVLRSPIVRVSEDVLAQVRLHDKRGTLYDALCSFVVEANTELHGETFDRLVAFVRDLEEWRTLARKSSLPELLAFLYRETGYYDFVGGMSGGKQRQANLQLLYDRAKGFEQSANQGLFRFLTFIHRMKKRGDDIGSARSLGEQEDVVRIMTIHKSKGLEFPVVFVANLTKQFNVRDLRNKFLIDQKEGLGIRRVDSDMRIQYDPIPLLALKEKLRIDQLSEEMRVLYVALTRAKEKLIFISTLKDVAKSSEKWRMGKERDELVLPSFVRSKATCYLDWIGAAFSDVVEFKDGETYQDKTLNVSVHIRKEQEFLEALSESEEEVAEQLVHIDKREPVEGFEPPVELLDRLSWQYPFEVFTKIASNTSVTEIKRKEMERETGRSVTLVSNYEPAWERPAFMQEKQLTSAERGTATHAVMQYIRLDTPKDEAAIRAEMEDMIRLEKITEAEKAAVNVESLVAFFESDLGMRLTQAGVVFRELPFSYGISVSELEPDVDVMGSDERVYVKGIIDCMFEDEEGFVLLDFKTDRILGKFADFESAKPAMLRRYKKQIEIYTRAIEDITKKRVTHKYLYFFDVNDVVEVE